MPTKILHADGAGYLSQWTPLGGARPTIVIDSNDATLLQVQNADLIDALTLDNPPSAANGGIVDQASVKSRLRAKTYAGGNPFFTFPRLGGVNSANKTVTPILTWAWYISAVHSRPGGGDWTVVDLATTELCIKAGNPIGNWLDVSEAGLVFFYTPASSGWSSLVVGLLGSVLGTGLLLAQMPDLIDACNHAARGKTIIHSHETVEMYNDLKADPHRSYLWL